MTNQRNDAVTAAYEAVAAKHLTPEERAFLKRDGGGMDTPDYDWARLHAGNGGCREREVPSWRVIAPYPSSR